MKRVKIELVESKNPSIHFCVYTVRRTLPNSAPTSACRLIKLNVLSVFPLQLKQNISLKTTCPSVSLKKAVLKKSASNLDRKSAATNSVCSQRLQCTIQPVRHERETSHTTSYTKRSNFKRVRKPKNSSQSTTDSPSLYLQIQ